MSSFRFESSRLTTLFFCNHIDIFYLKGNENFKILAGNLGLSSKFVSNSKINKFLFLLYLVNEKVNKQEMVNMNNELLLNEKTLDSRKEVIKDK